MKFPLLTVLMRRVFIILLVTGMLVILLSGLLIGLIKHIEHNVARFKLQKLYISRDYLISQRVTYN